MCSSQEELTGFTLVCLRRFPPAQGRGLAVGVVVRLVWGVSLLVAWAGLTSPGVAAETADGSHSYQVERAAFRCDKMNRGLAFDGRHFWVGEFGGWVRCYDKDGRPLPKRDLGGGTVRYLGHGVACGADFVATGARDFLAVLPKDGRPMRRIEPPVKGALCAVASDGATLWAMNYESPVAFQMDLEGRLLRQITTAQVSSSTSHDMAVDGDGHLYVLEGSGGGSRTLWEYSPDGKLLNTHTLAVPATAVAIDPNDSQKTLYTTTFAGDPVVYAYRRVPGEPKRGPLPRLAHPRRYRPEGTDFVIENGEHRFNRPLYGSNTAFYVHAGDRPEFLLSLPGKGGTLWLGIVAEGKSKWLSAAERIVARYRGGGMGYEIRDPLLGPGRLSLDVVPLADAEGVVLRAALSEDAPPVELAWAFGGASGFNRLNLDTCGYCPESACLLRPEDCEGNAFRLTDEGFELRASCHGERAMAGTMPPDSHLTIADADKLASPTELLASRGEKEKRPILTGRRGVEPGAEVFLALELLAKEKAATKRADLPAVFSAAEARRKAIAERVRVTAPEPVMQAAAAAISAAGDGLWDPPTYSHGGVRWHFPYLGWRGAYIASEFGWHERARTHFRAFARVQLKEPATGKPHADPECDLARQASDSVLYTRGYIPVFPEKDARNSYDMQQVYIDQLLWHLLWTGDVDFAREIWPVIVDHLDWEKRCFDPDDDGLFENFANTLVSDAHHYSGGACTQASAYNYRAFRMAARLAEMLGEDPAPLRREAERIHAAMNEALWMPRVGWFAEYRDLLGLKRLHPSAELPSVYHPIDSDVPDPFQAHQMLRYVDTQIEHVPVEGDSMTLWLSNWVPYIWSVRNVLGSETAHTALAYWQAGRREKAYRLYRGAIVDAMLCSRAPGACQGTSDHDGHWTGVATDFSCSVGMFGRTLVEGLFGIVPDALAGELLIRPGLPRDWDSASIDTPDVGYTYARTGNVERFEVRARFKRPMRLRLQAAARGVRVGRVTVDGHEAEWKCTGGVGEPVIEIRAPAGDAAKRDREKAARPGATGVSPVHGQDARGTRQPSCKECPVPLSVQIAWEGPEPQQAKCPAVVGLGETFDVDTGPAGLREVHDPQRALADVARATSGLRARAVGLPGHRTVFLRVEQGDLSWWMPLAFEIRPALQICDARVDRERAEVQFAVRNNTDGRIATEATIACQAAAGSTRLEIPPRSTSGAIRLPAKGLVPGTNPIRVALASDQTIDGAVVDWRKPAEIDARGFECVDFKAAFNDRVSQIFRHEYRSPRSPYCSLQMPLHGYGDWCYGGKTTPEIDDAVLRAAAGAEGRLVTPQGVPFATPGPGEEPNVVFTSQWDNFPETVDVPLAGRARHAWFLVAGSTHPMHSQLDNGEIVVTYAEGEPERLALRNPTTWWPIEADYQVEIDGFSIPGPHPPRIDLGKGRATLLDLPLDPDRDLRALTVRCLANEVVVGLMSATLLREPEVTPSGH